MIDHVSIPVRDLGRAMAFYDGVLGALGMTRLDTRTATAGYGKTYPEFWLNLRGGMASSAADSGVHVAIRARSAGIVEAFHAAALNHGGASDGVPGPRPQFGDGYYAAFIRDPDGNRLEAVAFLTADKSG